MVEVRAGTDLAAVVAEGWAVTVGRSSWFHSSRVGQEEEGWGWCIKSEVGLRFCELCLVEREDVCGHDRARKCA